MAIQVEIEGRSPNTFLDVGERRVVTRTALINNMVRGGFVSIVRLIPAEHVAVAVPDKSARKAEWSAFLTDRGIKYLESDTKATLIERWEHADTASTDTP